MLLSTHFIIYYYYFVLINIVGLPPILKVLSNNQNLKVRKFSFKILFFISLIFLKLK